MTTKHAQLDQPGLRSLYRSLGDLVDRDPDDPGMPELADRVVRFIEAADDEFGGAPDEQPIDENLIALLDAAFFETVPCAARLLELLEERGWTGWTNIKRIAPMS